MKHILYTLALLAAGQAAIPAEILEQNQAVCQTVGGDEVGVSLKAFSSHGDSGWAATVVSFEPREEVNGRDLKVTVGRVERPIGAWESLEVLDKDGERILLVNCSALGPLDIFDDWYTFLATY